MAIVQTGGDKHVDLWDEIDLCFLTGDLSRTESQEEESRSFIICECNQTYVSAPPRLECQFLEVDILELRRDVYLLYQFS